MQYWIPDVTMNLPFHFSVSVNYHSDHGKVQAESRACASCSDPSASAETRRLPTLALGVRVRLSHPRAVLR